jgi:Na+-driven multidrug efflux pump
MTSLVATFGTTGVAAYGVGITIYNVVFVFALGLSMATATLVGQHLGAGRIERASHIARLSVAVAFIGFSALGLALNRSAPAIVSWFVPGEPAVIADATTFLQVFSVAFGFLAAQLALLGTFRAAGNVVVAMLVALLSQWFLQLPLAFVLGTRTSYGLHGLWYAFPIATMLTATAAFGWFLTGAWKQSPLTRAIARHGDTIVNVPPARPGVNQPGVGVV